VQPQNEQGQPQQAPQQQPAARQPGGVNSLPLPIGQPVAINANTLTPKERQDLETIGWEPGMPIPNNLADWIEKAKKEATEAQFMPPPTDPSLPPVQVPKVVDIQDLPEAKRQELEQVLRQTQMQAEAQAREAASMPTQAGRGVAEAIRATEGGARQLELDDDVSPQQQIPDLSRPLRSKVQAEQAKEAVKQQAQAGRAQASPQQQPQTQPQAPAQPKPQQAAETAPQLHVCPNCAWDLAAKDLVEISEADKQNFLAATLGNKPFQKLFELMNGQLQVTLRSLRHDEVDACYRQCYEDRKNQQIANSADFMEQLNRYRLCLQLVELRSGEDLVQFPETLAEWGSTGDYRAMPMIFEQVFNEALSSETLMRLATKCMHKFNRILARLEANCDNPDFWEAAESAN